MLYEITQATALSDHCVVLKWSDGAQATVDLSPIIARGKVYAAMQDPAYFAREMRILPNGIGLGWPNDVDFSADGLRNKAFPHEDDVALASGPACAHPSQPCSMQPPPGEFR